MPGGTDRPSAPCRRLIFPLLGLVTMIPSLSLADAPRRPFWTEQAMFRFGEDLFFVGEATCAKSAEDGRQRAFANGIQEMLNYAQARAAAGIEIATQMIFEEPHAPGCPAGTISVWRLLRADADRVAKLPKGPTRKSLEDDGRTAPPPPSPKDLTPRVGMNRDDILDRFGRPKFITIMRGGKETHWEYPRFGLSLILDEDNLLGRWRLAGPQGPVQGGASHAAGAPSANVEIPDTAPPLDLTLKLRDLEQTPSPGVGLVPKKQVAVAPRPPHEETLRPPDSAPAKSLASHAFAATTRQTHGLGVIRLNTSPYLDRQFLRYHCEMTAYTLSVRYAADGSGPHTSLDHWLSDTAETEFRTAVTAGAQAAGYDPRYLSVRLTLPINGEALKAFGPDATIQAAGAGAAWAVGTASALLGDSVRTDASVLGTLNLQQDIGSVENLEEKIAGCRQSVPNELIVSAHQEGLELALSKLRMGVRVTPVLTLPEAYQAATGQPLRQAR